MLLSLFKQPLLLMSHRHDRQIEKQLLATIQHSLEFVRMAAGS